MTRTYNYFRKQPLFNYEYIEIRVISSIIRYKERENYTIYYDGKISDLKLSIPILYNTDVISVHDDGNKLILYVKEIN